jgi:transcriptional regulator with XRE-family HTH domain
MSETEVQLDLLQERIRKAPGDLIARKIKQARKEAGLSHDTLGERLGGVSRQHLIKLEKAVHRPRAALLLSISEETSRDVDWFLAPEVDPGPERFPVGAAA